MTLVGWNRPDAGFLAALAAGGLNVAFVVTFLVHRLRAGPGVAGPSRSARWGTIAGTCVASWLMVLAWLEGGVWLTPQLVLWLWPGALLLTPVPAWMVAPASNASWLVIAMAVNGLLYALAAFLVHLVVMAGAALAGQGVGRLPRCRGDAAHRLH